MQRVHTERSRLGRRQADTEFRLLAENVRDVAIFLMDPEGYITSWNPAATRMKGWAAEEAIGQHYRLLFLPDDAAAHKPEMHLEQARTTGKFEEKGWRTRKDGSRFWAHVTLTPLFDGAGQLHGFAKFTHDRSEERAHEERLRRQFSLTEAILNHAADAMFLLDAAGRTTFVNAAAGRMFGWTRDELLGKVLHEVVHYTHPDGSAFPPCACPLAEVFRSGTAVKDHKALFIHQDGHWVPVLCSTTPLTEEGQVTGAVLVVHDQEAHARDAVLLANVRDSVIVTDPNGTVTYWNEGATRLFGWEASEMLGRPLTHRFPEHARAWIEAEITARTRGIEWTGEFEDYRKDGSRVWIDARVRAITDAVGNCLGIMGIAHDVSERKQAEQALREAEAGFRTIIEQSPFSIQIVTPDGVTRLANPAFEELWGVPREALEGYNLLQDAQLARKGVLDQIRRAFAGERVSLPPVYYDPAENGAPGRGRWTEALLYPIRDDAGEIREVVLMHRDITDRQQAEEERAQLLFREQQAREKAETLAAERDTLLQEMVDGVIIADPEGRIVFVNEAARRMHGVMELGVPVEGYADVYHLFTLGGEPYPAEELPLARAVQRGETVVAADWLIRRPDGSEVIAQGSATPVVTGDGMRLGAVLLARDVTAQRALERQKDQLLEELAETDRRKDEFLAMLAHELRNPLAPIRNAVHLMRAVGPGSPTLERAQDAVERQVQQMARLIDDLLDVSRITRGAVSLRKQPLDLTSVVTDAVQTSRPLIEAKTHQLSVSLPMLPIQVEGDPTRLEQIITNLLNNAAKYTDPGGHLSLVVERERGQAVIRVRDTGVGIAPELLPHVFDLFVQAERAPDRTQGGLGIGLTLVRSLIEMHGGQVEARSAGVGLGSEFLVRLPALPEPPPVRAKALPRSVPCSVRPLRVLVVDDNRDAAETLSDLLVLWGHQVRVAHDGPRALAVALELRPEVVLLDIGLPGMDGHAVARRLRREPILSGCLLIALTGYGQEEDRRRSAEAGFDHHLVKPIDPQELQPLLVVGG